jgi:hypothetical protein
VKFPLGLNVTPFGDEAKQSLHHPPVKLIRLQVHEDMVQIINITDFSAFDLGSLQFENRHRDVSFLQCSMFWDQFTNYSYISIRDVNKIRIHEEKIFYCDTSIGTDTFLVFHARFSSVIARIILPLTP